MKEFADEIDFKLEMDPEVIKESLRLGLKDTEKGDGSYKIRPIFINEEEKYSPLSPYDNSKYNLRLFSSMKSRFFKADYSLFVLLL